MDPANYAKLSPVADEVVLERLGELQSTWDEHEDLRESAQADVTSERNKRDAITQKMHKIVRAHRAGDPVFILNDGNLTTEAPDEPDPQEEMDFNGAEEPAVHGEAEADEEPELTDL